MKLLLISQDIELRAAIARLCAARNPSIAMINEVPSMIRPQVWPVGVIPEILIYDSRDDGSDSLRRLEEASVRFPQAAIILLAPVQSPELLIGAMRLGVREVVPAPISLSELDHALERLLVKLQESRRTEGKLVSLISCKGGSGTTFVAANFGHALASIAQKKTLLIDLNLQFGDAALMLSDTKPVSTLSDICRQMHRLDAELLDSSLMKISPNFSLLAASSEPDPEDEIRPEQIESIMALAKRQYDFVLLDLGRQINGIAIRALDNSDVICPVLQQHLPYLRNGRRLLDIFASLGYRRDKVHQIVNRFDSGAPVSLGDLERSLGQKVMHILPNNFEIASESVNQGMPVLQLARSSNLAKGFVDLVHAFTDAHAASGTGLIRRLFVRSGAPLQ